MITVKNRAIGFVVCVSGFDGPEFFSRLSSVRDNLLELAKNIDTDDVTFVYHPKESIDVMTTPGLFVAKAATLKLPQFFDIGKACKDSITFLNSLDDNYEKSFYLIVDSYHKKYNSKLISAITSCKFRFFVVVLGDEEPELFRAIEEQAVSYRRLMPPYKIEWENKCTPLILPS